MPCRLSWSATVSLGRPPALLQAASGCSQAGDFVPQGRATLTEKAGFSSFKVRVTERDVQMAALAAVGPGHSQELGASSGSSTLVQGPKHKSHKPTNYLTNWLQSNSSPAGREQGVRGPSSEGWACRCQWKPMVLAKMLQGPVLALMGTSRSFPNPSTHTGTFSNTSGTEGGAGEGVWSQLHCIRVFLVLDS